MEAGPSVTADANDGTKGGSDGRLIIVMPVEWGDLSRDTFLWYVDNAYCDSHYVHICHVPDFRRHLQTGISPEAVMEIMIETNAVSEQLKKVYESLLQEKKINGKFVRVAGNNRWSAIVEYCKLVGASMIVLGTQPKPGPFQQEPHQQPPQQQQQPLQQQQQSQLEQHQPSAESVTSGAAATRVSRGNSSCRRSSEVFLQDVGPAFGTVTDDVLQHCEINALVYRQPFAVKGRGSLPRRTSDKK